MKNKLILHKEEYQLFKEKCSGFLDSNGIVENEDKSFAILIREENLEKCVNIVEELLILEGFDKNYNITPKGILYEKIIDEFYNQLNIS